MKDTVKTYFRAFKSFRAFTTDDKACSRERKIYRQCQHANDQIELIQTECIIQSEWVEKIEVGLISVEKALAQERQFIKSEGDVVNIEKVKHVSKDSIRHLGTHSSLITREPDEEGNIVPDSLLMVERENDYAVYENRFLYMLLCYIRDFISIRLKKIQEVGNEYQGKLSMVRDVKNAEGHFRYECTYEENSSNQSGNEEKRSFSLRERVENELHLVMSYLSNPIMVIVAKAPMLKPPITKTNVLRMNPDFQASVALYEYLSGFEGDGFEIRQNRKTLSPLDDVCDDELCDVMALNSFLVREYSCDLKKTLEEDFEAEEKKKKEKEREELDLRIEQLRREMNSKKISSEEYIARITDELKNTNKELIALSKVSEENEALQKKIQKEKEEKEQIQRELKEFQTSFAKELSEKKKLLDEESREYAKSLNQEKEDYKNRLEEEARERENVFKEREAALKENEAAYENQKKAEEQKNALLLAELVAYRRQNGKVLAEDETFVNEADFTELGKAFSAFYDAFDLKWKEAKKGLRKDLLWVKASKLKEKMEQ